MRRLITNLLLALLCLASPLLAQDMRMDTYCNPLNVDYTYMIYNSSKDISYRSGADPAVVEFRGEYYMFVTRTATGILRICKTGILSIRGKTGIHKVVTLRRHITTRIQYFMSVAILRV